MSPAMRPPREILNVAHVAKRDGVAQPGRDDGPPIDVGEGSVTRGRMIARAEKPHAEVGLQHGQQRLGANRLGQVVDASGVTRVLADVPNALAVTAITGMAAVAGSRASRRVASSPSRSLHLEIHEDDGGPMRPRKLDRLEPASRSDDLTPALSSRLARMRRFAVLSSTTRAVNACAGRESGVGRRRRRFDGVMRRRVAACPGQRQREAEPAALADDTLDLQIASHLRDQMMADGETQARAAGRGASLGLREGGEDLRQRLRLDAGAACR